MSARNDYPMLDSYEREDFRLYLETYYKKNRHKYVTWGFQVYWRISKKKRVSPSTFRNLMAKQLQGQDIGLSEGLTLCPSELREDKYKEMATVIVYGDMFERGKGPGP